jgi:hypothetical protein
MKPAIAQIHVSQFIEDWGEKCTTFKAKAMEKDLEKL